MAGVGIAERCVAELGIAPSAVDLACLTGDEAVSVMRLAQRQKNAADAVHLAAVAEVGACAPDSGETVARMAAPDRWAADEIRAGLAISSMSANDLLDFAWTVVRRLPKLHTAMGARRSRRRPCADHRPLDQGHVRRARPDRGRRRRWIGARSTPPTRTRRERLSARCKELGIALDPDWALRVFAEALKARRVIGWRNEDGTSDLAAQRQHPERVAAAIARSRRWQPRPGPTAMTARWTTSAPSCA